MGLDPVAQDIATQTPQNLAGAQRSAFIDLGANANARIKDYWTPIQVHFSAANGHLGPGCEAVTRTWGCIDADLSAVNDKGELYQVSLRKDTCCIFNPGVRRGQSKVREDPL